MLVDFAAAPDVDGTGQPGSVTAFRSSGFSKAVADRVESTSPGFRPPMAASEPGVTTPLTSRPWSGGPGSSSTCRAARKLGRPRPAGRRGGPAWAAPLQILENGGRGDVTHRPRVLAGRAGPRPEWPTMVAEWGGRSASDLRQTVGGGFQDLGQWLEARWVRNRWSMVPQVRKFADALVPQLVRTRFASSVSSSDQSPSAPVPGDRDLRDTVRPGSGRPRPSARRRGPPRSVPRVGYRPRQTRAASAAVPRPGFRRSLATSSFQLARVPGRALAWNSPSSMLASLLVSTGAGPRIASPARTGRVRSGLSPPAGRTDPMQ